MPVSNHTQGVCSRVGFELPDMRRMKAALCCGGLALLGSLVAALGVAMLLAWLQLYGEECTDDDLANHTRTGLLMLRNVSSKPDVEALVHQANHDSNYFCGVNTHPLDDVSRAMRQRCKLALTDLCRTAPQTCETFGELNVSRPDGTSTRGMDFDSNATFVRMHATRGRVAALALGLIHSFQFMPLERSICPSRPWLCQGFHGWHLDDQDLLPKQYNRVLLMLEKSDVQHSNVRVLPRGALARTGARYEALLGALPRWQQVGLSWLLSAVWQAHAAILGDQGHFVVQIAHSLAGCTARFAVGDALIMAWDVRHQTQGSLADRLLLILSSCASCDASCDANGMGALPSEELRSASTAEHSRKSRRREEWRRIFRDQRMEIRDLTRLTRLILGWW